MILGGILVLLVAAVMTLHWLRAGEPLALDTGLFACFSRWVPRGALPYRDLFDSKPPLFLYSWALASVVPGDVALSMWRLETLWLLGSMAATFVLVRRIAGEVAGLASAGLLVFGLWCPAWGGYWSRAQAEELAVLPMMLAAGVALVPAGSELRVRRLILLGVLTGVIGLYKIPTMAVAAAWPMLWIEHGRRRTAIAAGWVGLGLALPWIVVALVFAVQGAFGDLVEGMFVYHRYNAEFIAPAWLPTIGTFLRTMVTSVPELLVLAGAGLASLPGRERRFVAVWIASTSTAVVLQRQLAGYHYLLVVPGLVVAAGCGAVALGRAVAVGVPRRRAIAGAIALLVLGLAVRGVIAWGNEYAPDLAYARGQLTRSAYLDSFERGTISPAQEEELAAWVRAHVPADEHILIWGLAPGVYALADRTPATRYPFHKILMTDAPLSRLLPGLETRRAELLARIEHDRPAVIIVGRNDRNGFEPETSLESLVHWPALMSLVKSRYALETEIGHFMVFRRRP
ncbi:hypothetical protein BH11MYX3_BH11MYX3_35880 [soil metagenome]